MKAPGVNTLKETKLLVQRHYSCPRYRGTEYFSVTIYGDKTGRFFILFGGDKKDVSKEVADWFMDFHLHELVYAMASKTR